VKICGK